MGYTMKFSGENAEADAIQAIRDYVGDDFFDKINALLKEAIETGEILNYQKFQMTLYLFPVSGFPILAWYRSLCAEVDLPPLE